jgi:hypothetical protein
LRSQHADLEALVADGRGDMPLIKLRLAVLELPQPGRSAAHLPGELEQAKAIAQLTEFRAEASLWHRRRSQCRQGSCPHVGRAHAEFMAKSAAEP